MTTKQAHGLDTDDPPRDSKRIKLIQSEVDAEATKEAQEFYITRLNENYKKQLEAMEQEHGEQIQALKSQLASSAEKLKAGDRVSEQKVTEAAKDSKKQLEVVEQGYGVQKRQIQDLKSQLAASAERKKADDIESENKAAGAARAAAFRKTVSERTEEELAESRKSCLAAQNRATKAEQETEERLREQASRMVKLKRRHTAELKEALEDIKSCVEVGFTKRFLTTPSSAPKLAIRRLTSTFAELAKLAIETDRISGRIFEYKKRTIPVADYNKTLREISGVTVTTGIVEQSTNLCVLAWL